MANFGDVAAEHDPLLGSSFLVTTAYTAVIRDQRYIVLGRKGAGKTALYVALQSQTGLPNSRVVGLNLKDYPWKLHDDALNSNASPRERHVNTWHFLILVELAKLAIQDEVHPNEAQRALRDFVEKNWGNVAFSIKDFFRRERYELAAEVRPTVAGFSIGSIQRRAVDRARLGESLGGTIEWLERALVVSVGRQVTYLVAFDGLELSYAADDSGYSNRVIGLLLAADRVAEWADRHGFRIRAVVFVRQDIFDSLHFSEKNKLRVGASATIGWTESPKQPDDLLSLMRKRIRALVPDLDSGQDPWHAFFPKAYTIHSKGRDPAYDRESMYGFITRRTCLRPRDMIHFANLALQRAQYRLRHSGTSPAGLGGQGTVPFVLPGDVKGALPSFSQFLLDELDDEIAGVHPRWREYFEILRWIDRPEFTAEQFAQRFAELRDPPLSAGDALQLLFTFSVVGFIAGSRPQPVFAYKEPDASLDPHVERFMVHPGLLGVFRYRSSESGGPPEPP